MPQATIGKSRPTPLDVAMAALAVFLVGGFYIDLWAHSHGRVDDSFFTPWHGILYAGAFAIGAVLFVIALRSRAKGTPWRNVLPKGYGLSLIGASLFLVAGLLDLAWHEVFGFETDIEDLLSPTHIILATSGVFMVAGPIRSAWARGVPGEFPGWLPWALSLMAILSILTAFTSYAHPAVGVWATVGEDQAAVSAIVLIDVESGNQTRLNLNFGDNFWQPDTFADGSILVAAEQDGRGTLHVLEPDGSSPTRIWEGEGVFHYPEVSPDGESVAFSAEVDGYSQIFLVPARGGESTRLTSGPTSSWDPSWDPAGEHLVFVSEDTSGSDLWLIDDDGSDLRQLTDLDEGERAPQWSPDGARIVFESRRPDGADIFIIDSDGSNPVQITSGDWFDLGPSWSPDGSTILFASDRDDNVDLYTVPAEGGEPVKVVDMPAGNEGWAGSAWSLDGATIIANSSGWSPPWLDEVTARVRGVTGVLIQSVLIAGLLLLILRHGPLPSGVLTTIFVLNAALMTVFADNYWYVIPVLLTAVVAEIAVAVTRNREQVVKARVLSSLVPAVWFALYLVTAAVVEGGLVWSWHMTAGAPVLAGIAGFLLSLVVYPSSWGEERSAAAAG